MPRSVLLTPFLLAACSPAVLYPSRVGHPVVVCEGDTATCDEVSILDVPFGRSASLTLTVANDGHGLLDAALATTSATFTVEPAGVLLDAGLERDVDLTYAPSSFDPATADLVITWDPEESPLEVPLAGTTDDDADDDAYRHHASPGGTDCNDFNATVHPDADDPSGDGIDQDCDGTDG